jgi:signal transduction histidine kinase
VNKNQIVKKIWGDRERVGQVLTNLISNAIKYSPSAQQIVIKATDDKKAITISVQDFGVGIPASDLPNIFERFYRAEGKERQSYPGLGLGLYIASEIVRRHKGKIWAESNGKGSTFHFSLPVKK